ncbi:LppM family (lipo)protein [Pseudonocardia sp. RS010]|uniref:LppM family (lipo)protein n=1 Tax=Pseudonocardia sp. RS010 TaxID=3385979 RepID=UPI0039A3CFB1
MTAVQSPPAPRRDRPRGRPRPARTSRFRRVVSVLLLVATAVAVLGGCARVRAALAIQPDDTVTGEIVIATPEKGPDDTGPAITLPPELASDVDVSEYRQDGYAGSVLRFSGLTFDQVGQLTGAVQDGDRANLTLRRAGNRIVLAGAADLTTVPVDRADFQLKVSFPGEVLDTNGDSEAGTVSWTFTPGEVGDVDAVVAYDDPQAPSATAWSLGLAVVVAGAVAAVVLLARRTRNPPVRR